jgi:ribosomal protein L11 methyltransferase
VRAYPALDVTWPAAPPDEAVDGLVLAIIDEDRPLSLEERAGSVRVYFASPGDRDRALARIVQVLPDAFCVALDVPDEEWPARSQAGLAAVVVDRVIVSPPWDVRHADDAVTVVIQPSMGFGTGHHASTRLCLRLLQQIPALEKMSVLDAGTGSGVLAIAAARLGARSVVAIDSDPDALHAAAENVALNRMESRVVLRQVDLAAAGTIAGAPFDLVLANLTGALLAREAATLGRLARSGGALVASGIEGHEADAVAAAFARTGCALVERLDEDGWVGLLARIHDELEESAPGRK